MTISPQLFDISHFVHGAAQLSHPIKLSNYYYPSQKPQKRNDQKSIVTNI